MVKPAVAEPLRNDGSGYTAKMHQSAAGVPSVVQPDGRQPGRVGEAPKLIGEPLGAVRHAQLIHHQMGSSTLTTAR
jgi:hypothetical protein